MDKTFQSLPERIVPHITKLLNNNQFENIKSFRGDYMMMFKKFVLKAKMSTSLFYMKIRPQTRFDKWLQSSKMFLYPYPNYPHPYNPVDEGG